MSEVVFVIEGSAEGGYSASAVGPWIVTEADSLENLRDQVRDAVRCHFEGDEFPKLIRLHFVRDEVIVA